MDIQIPEPTDVSSFHSISDNNQTSSDKMQTKIDVQNEISILRSASMTFSSAPHLNYQMSSPQIQYFPTTT